MNASIDLADVIGPLSGYLARIEDPIPFFDFVGTKEVLNIRDRIQNEKMTPDGAAWPEWADLTKHLRAEKGNVGQGMLWDTGALLNSIRFEVDGNFSVDIGSDLWYAANQQDGLGIPKREFVGWEDKDLQGYAQAFVIYIEGSRP